MRNRDAEKIKILEEEKEALELKTKDLEKTKKQARKDRDTIRDLER